MGPFYGKIYFKHWRLFIQTHFINKLLNFYSTNVSAPHTSRDSCAIVPVYMDMTHYRPSLRVIP